MRLADVGRIRNWIRRSEAWRRRAISLEVELCAASAGCWYCDEPPATPGASERCACACHGKRDAWCGDVPRSPAAQPEATPPTATKEGT
jgi:hypothetical protein